VVSETHAAFAAARTDPVAISAAMIFSLLIAISHTPLIRGSFQK
jgi:hypothetical protein